MVVHSNGSKYLNSSINLMYSSTIGYNILNKPIEMSVCIESFDLELSNLDLQLALNLTET